MNEISVDPGPRAYICESISFMDGDSRSYSVIKTSTVPESRPYIHELHRLRVGGLLYERDLC